MASFPCRTQARDIPSEPISNCLSSEPYLKNRCTSPLTQKGACSVPNKLSRAHCSPKSTVPDFSSCFARIGSGFLSQPQSQGLPQLTEVPRARKQSAPGPRRSSRRRASSSLYADTPNQAPADHAADRSCNARADRSGNARAEQDDIPSAVPQLASLLTTGLNPRSVTAAVSTALHPLLARVERLEERISARQDPDGHAQAAVPSVADVVQTASNTVTHHPPQVDSGPMDISLMQPSAHGEHS